MRRQTILVVDDDKAILDSLSFMLNQEGFNVLTDDGENVFKKIKVNRPNIILLDVLLREVDGRDICKKIKEENEFKNIPIILFSAHPSVGVTYRNCGADAYLPKPFDNITLLALINRLIISNVL